MKVRSKPKLVFAGFAAAALLGGAQFATASRSASAAAQQGDVVLGVSQSVVVKCSQGQLVAAPGEQEYALTCVRAARPKPTPPTTATTTTTPSPTTTTTVPPDQSPPSVSLDPSIPITTNSDGGWAGYILQGGKFTSVSGTMKVMATLNCELSAKPSGSQASNESTWVGIDGWSPGPGLVDAHVVQAGVGYCWNGRTPTVWYEMYPVNDPIYASWTPRVGDSVTASIDWMGGAEWGIHIKDDNTGQHTDVYAALPGFPQQSAEWITESDLCPSIQTNPELHFSQLSVANTQSEVKAVDIADADDGCARPTPTPEDNVGSLLSNGFSFTPAGA